MLFFSRSMRILVMIEEIETMSTSSTIKLKLVEIVETTNSWMPLSLL